MPIRLINPDVPVKWVHPIEKGKENATVFHIVALTEGKARELQNTFVLNQSGGKPDVNGFKMAMFLHAVKAIDRVIMPGDSTPRSISAPEDIRLFLDCLPVEYAPALYDAIQNVTFLDEGAIKNFDESPALPRS